MSKKSVEVKANATTNHGQLNTNASVGVNLPGFETSSEATSSIGAQGISGSTQKSSLINIGGKALGGSESHSSTLSQTGFEQTNSRSFNVGGHVFGSSDTTTVNAKGINYHSSVTINGEEHNVDINSASIIQSCIEQCQQLSQSCEEFGRQFTKTVSSIKIPNFKLGYISDTVSGCLGRIQHAASSTVETLRSLSPEDTHVFSSIQEAMTGLINKVTPNLSRIGGALESAGRMLSEIKLRDFSRVLKAVNEISQVACALGSVALNVLSNMP